MVLAKKYFLLLMCLELWAFTNAKRRYNLEVESIEIFKSPAFYFNIEQLRIGLYNSSTRIINGNVTCKQDLPMNTMVDFTMYELMASHKFSKIPVRLIPCPLCYAVNTPNRFYAAFLPKSNFPKKCPVKKGSYWLKNFSTLDFKELPDQLPGERWRVDTVFSSNRRTIGNFSFVFYINRYI